MSQKIPFPPVPQDRNIYVKYQKVLSRGNNKVRSGILERYTYKTDNGKLLSSTSVDKNYNEENNPCSKLVSVPQNANNLHANNSSISRTTIIKTNVNKNIERSLPPLPTKHHAIHQNVLKLGNSSREHDEKVRTEHCDSTTDIIENMEKETMKILEHEIKLFTDDDYYERYKKFSPSYSNSDDMFIRSISPQLFYDNDSDSDCQIIDVKLNDCGNTHVSKNKDRYPVSQDETLTQNSDKTLVVIDNLSNDEESPNTKVLSWISSKLEEPMQPVIHVISDSEEEETFLCDKTGMKKPIKKTDFYKDYVSSEGNPDQESGSVSSLVLPSISSRTSPELTMSEINTSSKIPVVFKNVKYNSTMHNFKSDKKTQDTSDIELSQQNLLLKLEPPEMYSSASLLNKPPTKPVLENRLEVTPPKIQKLNVQIQKVNSQLSPESMKSEFYSYLKINTNPSAQKTETIAQNRRSTRVKNLILQIEKDKELKNESTTNEKPKNNDVRKKFMKYSKFSIVFPPPSIHNNKISDFTQTIEEYFLEEKINYKLLSSLYEDNEERKNKRIETEVTRTKKIRSNAIVDYYPKNKKYISTKKLLKMSRKNQLKQKIEASYDSHLLADKKLRRLRFGPNRILRNSSVRITRHSLDGCKRWNKKMLKARKAKLKAKIKDRHEQSVAEKVKQESNKLNATINHSERVIIKNHELNTSILPCITAQVDKSSLPTILAKKLSDALHKPRPAPEIEPISKSLSTHSKKHVQEQSDVETENCPTTSNLKTTDSKTDKQTVNSPKLCSATPVFVNSGDNKIPEFSPYTPMDGTETENRFKLVYHGTPIYKSDSEKELEFSTSLFQDTSAPNKEKLDEIFDNLNKRNISPPFLGFTSNEGKRKQNIKLLNVSLIDIKLKPKTITKPELEIQEHDQVLKNAQLQDVISISSSENSTAIEEDSNSEQFSETSSIQEETQVIVQEVVDTNLIESGNPNYIPLNQNIKTKSFHKSLMQSCVKRKTTLETSRSGLFELSDSDSSMSTPKTPKGNVSRRSQTHEIDINKNNGAVFNTYYINGILIIVQEQLITFWKQTALGNILGVQNMWLPHGSIQRIILDPGCVNRRSSEMVLSCDNSVAYVELWTKEHKCVFRECPIADVFATIYFHKGHGLPDKKVLQLENIKGYGDDVRFAVSNNSREIIVSWCDTFSKPIKTLVRSYQLASDFQTVCSIKEMEFVSHHISSLHNIHDCGDLFLGAGNEQISVWNLRHGYLVTTLNLSETPVQSPSENKTICLYVLCDTGFLFLIQQTEVGILRLVAVNGMTQEWKQLHSYQVPDNYKKLLGVVVESGVLMTCYTNGFLCWNMHSGEVLAEIDTPNELIVLPSNKYLVAIDNYQVTVQHIMSYILTHDW